MYRKTNKTKKIIYLIFYSSIPHQQIPDSAIIEPPRKKILEPLLHWQQRYMLVSSVAIVAHNVYVHTHATGITHFVNYN